MADRVSKDTATSHHLKGEMADTVIIYHSEDIQEMIAERLDSAKNIEIDRFDGLHGEINGKQVSLLHTGMGAGNTGIVVDQAIDQGADTIIKIGSFGALQDDIDVGDILLVNGAVRSEGMTDAYAPIQYPAVPSADLMFAFRDAAEQNDVTFNTGIIHSVNIYSQYYEDMYSSEKYDPEIFRNLGVKGVEMETSATYTIASTSKNVESLAVLVCNRTWRTQKAYMDGNEVTWRSKETERQKYSGYEDAIKTVIQMISSR